MYEMSLQLLVRKTASHCACVLKLPDWSTSGTDRTVSAGDVHLDYPT